MRIIQIIVVLIMVACIAISATALLTDELCVHADENRDHQCDMCSKEMGKCADENKDHKCDNGCDKPFETHQAADGKHTCDYCGKAVSECVDADTNHKCDVCNADMGTHGAADGKHTCDYCGKAVSECVDADTNHKCDVCNADMGTHGAADGKHTCDYCGKAVSECVDADTNHKCDVCNADMGTHGAADGKHTCDYCGKAVSECADADTNHKCDVCNADMGTHGAADGKHTCDYCGKAVSECVDADTNHKCDVCNADMGTHGAADGKHTCDYCGKAVSECVDADTNHKCDVCNADMGTHGAADGKHTCDYCGKAVSECADADTNHKCDLCNADMGTHGAAAGKHTCDYCGAKVTECTPEEDDGDCTTAILCSVCDAVLTAAKTHDFTGEWLSDADGHWHTCKNADCTATDTKASHVSSGAATETEDEKCTVCNYVINAALGHQHSYSTLKYDSENHWLECSCGEKSNVTAHIANEDDGNCTTAVTCQGCEYVMKAAEAEHKAADKSHNCAACGKELSDCADNDKDHKCDVCEAKLSDCADNNKDHKCDVCGAKLSECADNNKDHKCDLCGTKLSDCADNNKDHKCDLCGAKISDCADNNKDHNCDVCGTKLSDCADNNKDHNCDVCGAELYPTDGEREVNILYKGDSAYSFMAIDPAGNTDRSAIKGWFTPTVGTNVGLPTLMNPGANQYLQFNKTAQIELFFNKGSDGNTYHIFDNKTNWGAAGAQALFNKEYTYEFEVSANGAFVLSVCDFRTNMGTFADHKDLYGIQFLFDGNTIKMSRCSSGKVEAIAILEGVDFGDGTRRKISFAITRLDLDNGQIRVFVNEEKAMFEATADYGSTTISTNPTPGGTVVNGTLNFPDACKYGQRFTVAPQKLGDGYSTVNIYSYKKLFVKDYTEDNKYTVTLDGGLKFTDGSTTKVVDKYYDVLTNVDWAGYNGLYNVNTGSAFYGLITADVTLGGYSKDANDVIPTLQQLSNTNSNGKAGEVTKQNNYIVAGRLGARFTYNGEFTKDYKIRFCNTLANGQKFTGGVTYVSTFTIKNYSDKQLSFTLYEITSGHTLTNFKTHVDLAPGESGTYTIEWSFASANNMLPFIVFDNDHTGDNKGFDFGMALNVVEKK